MGGFGSGRQGWLPVIENGLKIDIRRMRKHGQFQHNVVRGSGMLTWSNTYTGEKVASIGFSYSTSASAPWFRLQYTVTRGDEDVDVDDWFQLEPFSQPYGGVRWYFVCPSTRTRAQCLGYKQVRELLASTCKAAGVTVSLIDQLTRNRDAQRHLPLTKA